ncbi:cobalamin biosynthesis protein CbiX [Opitutaceae bacterium EW11]|nr:cobalamin biosynthesis protein CbiX [Opitutaceae bacterium EW11]
MGLGRQVIYPAKLPLVHTDKRPQCFLFDNGSLRPASTLSLRRSAALLAEALRCPVEPVSLLHSSGVPASELGGVSARLLEPALTEWLSASPDGEAVLLPLFFGPSAALTDYVPERLVSLRQRFPDARLRLAHCLVDLRESDTRIAEALTAAARRTVRENGLQRPKVLVVDHGSPQRSVAAVRNHLGIQVNALLRDEATVVGVASMERRPGSEYTFNDPLLAFALANAPFDEGDVIVLLQFLSPGRHAGPDGDIAQICDEARRGRPQLRTYLSEPIGNDPRVIAVLVQRYEEALQSSFLGSIKPTSSA